MSEWISPEQQPAARLRELFQQHGYVRVADQGKRKRLGQKYKKGYEVRLVATTPQELAQIQRWLQEVGYSAGRPFQKRNQIIQPIYGKKAVEWFLEAEG